MPSRVSSFANLAVRMQTKRCSKNCSHIIITRLTNEVVNENAVGRRAQYNLSVAKQCVRPVSLLCHALASSSRLIRYSLAFVFDAQVIQKPSQNRKPNDGCFARIEYPFRMHCQSSAEPNAC